LENTKKVYLEDFDHVLVPLDPRKSVPKVATVGGYVMYPGTYSIRFEGERVASLIRRAGGLRAGASPAGSRLVRKANNAGLIPIDFEKALRDTLSSENIEVVDGDSIHVARLENVVYVRGEVFVPSAVLHVGGGSLSYYIQQAGGYKDEADEGRVVVFLPSGKKWESSWLSGQQILPGSVVYVPRKIEKEDNTLPIIRDLATMLASLAAITLAIYQATK
jgi:polysaccharide biosynthesis/export protein